MKEIMEETQDEEQKKAQGDKRSRRKSGVEKRRRANKVEKQARWSGLLMLGIIMLAGFLMWVMGEVNKNMEEVRSPREVPSASIMSGKVIVR